jgi:tetratricopeptide (TPR) repeat protein
LWGLSYTYFRKGYGKKCLDFGNTLLEYGNKHSNIRCQVVGHICVGLGYNTAGDYLLAIKSLEQGVAVAVDPFYSQWAKLLLAANYLSNKRLAEAEAALKEVWTYTTNFGCETIGALASALLGIVSIIKGNLSKGIKMVEETNQNIIESEAKGWIAFWGNMLGGLYLQMVQSGEKPSLSLVIKNMGFLIKNAPHADRRAKDFFQKAIRQAKEVGDNDTLGRAYLNLGLLHKAKKRTDKAKECISEAIKIFEETEADVFLKQTKEVLESLNN